MEVEYNFSDCNTNCNIISCNESSEYLNLIENFN